MNSVPEGGVAGPAEALPIALFGASGRMGRAVAHALADDPAFRIVGACAGRGSDAIGQDVGSLTRTGKCGVFVRGDPAVALEGARVAIDFSLPAATPAYANACRDAGCCLVSGVTGLDRTALEALERASEVVPVLHAPNLSVGVAVLTRLVEVAASALDGGFEAEILEAHHRAKRDAPSGTALELGEAVARARGGDLASLRAAPEREGPRKPNEIGFAVMRGGDIAGEHTVLFAGQGERLELTHRAGSREAFARGALRAAEWLAAPGRPPGRYDMFDVLGFDDGAGWARDTRRGGRLAR